LRKGLIQKIIDLYFNQEIIQPNTTNNTKQHQQHQTTLKKKKKKTLVALGDISGITPEKKMD